MPANELTLLLFSLGAFQGVLLSVLLKVKYRRCESSLLSLISLFFALMLGFYVAYWAKLGTPMYFWWVQYLTFLIAPLFYFLIRGISIQQATKWPTLLHFLPFVAAVLALYMPISPMFLFLLQPLHLTIYSVLSFPFARDRQDKVQRWLFIPFLAYTLLFVLYSAMIATKTLTLEFDYLIAAASCFFIYALLIKSYLQPQFINQLGAEEKLSTYISETVLSQIERHFRECKPYLNGDYRLRDLSNDLSLKPYQLSEIINQKYDGFNKLLNDYRIRESIHLLNDTSEKVIDIAHLSGFNNKVSFYKTFKKATGKTPAEWRRDPEKKVNIYTD
jgi:AraC-like DNA-binding protein